MPTQVSHPCDYVEEGPNGVLTIAEVANSITTFVGWEPEGPVDRDVNALNFQECERNRDPIYPKVSSSILTRNTSNAYASRSLLKSETISAPPTKSLLVPFQFIVLVRVLSSRRRIISASCLLKEKGL